MSRPPKFFISPDMIQGEFITLSGEDVRHVATVLRMKPGEMLLVSDGTGMEYTVRITGAGRSEVRTEIVSRAKRDIAYPRIILGQALPKFDKMDWIVQKATELGAASIAPFVSERTVVKLRDEGKRIERWQKIAKEAAMQSNRLDIPSIEPVRTFEDEVAHLSALAEVLFLPWEEAGAPIKSVLRQHAGAKTIAVLIGPEGGFSRAEAETARSHGFHPVSLGPFLLRTETAALAVLAVIGYECAPAHPAAHSPVLPE